METGEKSIAITNDMECYVALLLELHNRNAYCGMILPSVHVTCLQQLKDEAHSSISIHDHVTGIVNACSKRYTFTNSSR